jgi:serine/threonine protein kinase
VDAEKYRAA